MDTLTVFVFVSLHFSLHNGAGHQGFLYYNEEMKLNLEKLWPVMFDGDVFHRWYND